MPRIVSIILLLFCLTVHKTGQAQQSNKKWSVILKFHPLTLADPYMPVVQPALEIRYKRMSVQFNYGFNNDFHPFDTSSIHRNYIKGNRYRLEVRRYYNWLVNNRFSFGYAGVAFFTSKYDREMDQFSFHDKGTGKNLSFREAIIHKKVQGMAFKGGGFITWGKRFSLEFAPEIGIRIVDTKFTDYDSLEEITSKPRNALNYESSIQGKKVRPHIAISTSFNFRLL